MNIVDTVIRHNIGRFPILLVCLIGLIVAVRWWRRSRPLAGTALLGSCAIFFAEVAMIVYDILMARALSSPDQSDFVQSLLQLDGRMGLMHDITTAGGIGLLLLAIFMDRQQQTA